MKGDQLVPIELRKSTIPSGSIMKRCSNGKLATSLCLAGALKILVPDRPVPPIKRTYYFSYYPSITSNASA